MIIEIKDVEKWYGARKVLDVPTLKVAVAEVVGVVGNNGAGKTTLFRLLLDLIKAASGVVYSKGKDVSSSEEWKSYTGAYLDEGFLMEYLTPLEYFEFVGSLHGLDKTEVRDRLAAYADFFNYDLPENRKYIRDLSKGNKNKVGIVSAMLIHPQVLILDEPFASLDPTAQIRLKTLIKAKKSDNIAMLISSHDLNHIAEVCDRIVVLENGKVIQDLSTDSNTLKTLEAYFSL